MQARATSIVLIGMMGAGKSSVGRALQKRTGWQRFDLDEMIIAEAGKSIPEIFAQDGEETFRDMETAVLKKLPLGAPAIVVTGGGIILRPNNIALLKNMGTIFWLDAEVETLFERASRRGNRPLLQTENPRTRLTELMELRRPFYSAMADRRIDTTRLTHDQIADIILTTMKDREPAQSP